ncbi:Scn11a [Symbiodinium natans]|uniref:Scn11a protein n=1 Tax=Symbiodinium natans TaxID=878477 RepID=A0A812SDZ1_9DINO|nr:Scn11a [Symbiodinium natans]
MAEQDHHYHHENHSLWIRLRISYQEHPDIYLSLLRYWCFCLASKKMFDYVMGLVILVNAVCVGLEVQSSLRDTYGLRLTGQDEIGWMYWPPVKNLLDFAFVMAYIAEFLVRLLAWGVRKCFTDSWPAPQELESLLVVRSLRLLRLIRALRLLKQFRTVWRLVNGLLTSANAMVSTLVLVVLTLYIAACLGIEIITKDTDLKVHTETGEIVSRYFGHAADTYVVAKLHLFVTLDSVAPIYVPLITQKPWLALWLGRTQDRERYFFFIILFVSISLMNLVTAVLVEGALENASADKELEKLDLQEKLKSQMPRLLQIFNDIDKDGSGTLTVEEMSMVPVDVIPEELRNKSRVSSMHEVFEMLDVDGGGELTRATCLQLQLVEFVGVSAHGEEFVDGLLNLFLQDVPVATVQTLRLLRSVDARVWRLGEELCDMRNFLHGTRPMTDTCGNRPGGLRFQRFGVRRAADCSPSPHRSDNRPVGNRPDD